MQDFLRAFQTMESVPASLDVRPLPAASAACRKLPSWPDNPCLRALARRVSVRVGPPLKGSAQACATLTANAQRELIEGIETVAPAYASPIPELTLGARYPPTCVDILRVLDALLPVAAVGVMDDSLTGHNFARPRVVLVHASGRDAVVRVVGSHKTVHVRWVNGSWKIAALDFSDINRR